MYSDMHPTAETPLGYAFSFQLAVRTTTSSRCEAWMLRSWTELFVLEHSESACGGDELIVESDASVEE